MAAAAGVGHCDPAPAAAAEDALHCSCIGLCFCATLRDRTGTDLVRKGISCCIGRICINIVPNCAKLRPIAYDMNLRRSLQKALMPLPFDSRTGSTQLLHLSMMQMFHQLTLLAVALGPRGSALTAAHDSLTIHLLSGQKTRLRTSGPSECQHNCYQPTTSIIQVSSASKTCLVVGCQAAHHSASLSTLQGSQMHLILGHLNNNIKMCICLQLPVL